MYDEKDNRYLDCVNNVTHGMCMPPLDSQCYNVLGKVLIQCNRQVSYSMEVLGITIFQALHFC